jgi:sugar/nucleoside kinase (ribokinase family)
VGLQKAQFPRAWDVIGVGENSVDLVASLPVLPPPDSKTALAQLETRPGGQVATALVGCARLGLRSAYIGTFGADDHGRLIRSALVAEGVDVHACREVDAPNRSALILVEEAQGTRTVLWTRSPDLDWAPEAAPLALVAQSRALLVDTTDLPLSIAAARAARAAGTLTVADVDEDLPRLDDLLAVLDVLVVSSGLAGRLRELHARGPRLVVATLGVHGAVAWDGRRDTYSPGFEVPVVDTTGAGDAFRAGLLWAMLTDPSDPMDLMDPANAVAALSCRARGAQAGLPSAADVDALVTSAREGRSKRLWDPARMPPPPAPSRGGAR